MANQTDGVLSEQNVLFVHLRKLLPDVKFRAGEAFCWSAEHATVTYRHQPGGDKQSLWALLHEAGHALLDHKNYQDDIDLLQKEVAAWDRAKNLAQEHHLVIDDNHIEDCLDTYRDWLHQRSTCPRCGVVSLQVSVEMYQCYNCLASWSVSPSRLCRPYRLSKPQNKNRPGTMPRTVFQ